MVGNAIYGAGAFGKLFYRAMAKKGFPVDFFIDDFNYGANWSGLTVKTKDQVNKKTAIYISVLQHSAVIENDLKNKGFSNVINFSQSIIQIPEILSEISEDGYLWLVKDRSKMVNEKLEQVMPLLKDQKSKLLLEQIIALRKTLDPQYYITPNDVEYFPRDVPLFKTMDPINFIDCGAYTGDTVKRLMDTDFPVNYSISFEPDIKNYPKLLEELDRQKKQHPETSFIAYPSGVYSENTISAINSNDSASNVEAVTGSGTPISVVTLDSTIKNCNPNYIKMDIEGAEKEAIWGSRETIRSHKPNLAVCLYHRPEDLWELPLLIHDIEPSYDMYLRVHEDMCLSTVLYCLKQ